MYIMEHVLVGICWHRINVDVYVDGWMDGWMDQDIPILYHIVPSLLLGRFSKS